MGSRTLSEAHLVVGSTGAGKTTYAMRLAQDIRAVRFTIDEWMSTLFLKDSPDPISYQWALERVLRCERQILSVCEQLMGTGTDVVLDLGFFGREQRDRVRKTVAGMGMEVRFHYLPVPMHIRWERVSNRNAQQGETYAMDVTRGMFDFCETLFEDPTPEELAGALIVP